MKNENLNKNLLSYKEVTKIVSNQAPLSRAWFEVEFDDTEKVANLFILLPAVLNENGRLYLDPNIFKNIILNVYFEGELLKANWGSEDYIRRARYNLYYFDGANKIEAINNAINTGQNAIAFLESKMELYK